MGVRTILRERRWYYSLLFLIAILCTFSLFTRRELHRYPVAPSALGLGRQAFDAAWQRADADRTAVAAGEDAKVSSAPSYYDSGVWDPLGLNPAPLVEVSVKACIWPPSIWE
jgi:hypothetical protein